MVELWRNYGFDEAKTLCINYRKKMDEENNVQTREATLNDFR
jgi:hypothetical protein